MVQALLANKPMAAGVLLRAAKAKPQQTSKRRALCPAFFFASFKMFTDGLNRLHEGFIQNTWRTKICERSGD
jgi:hypothetical protein